MKKLILLLPLLLSSLLTAQVLELGATVISDNEKVLSSRYMGFIKNVYVNEGQEVQKGMLLYEIDSVDIDSKKEQAKLSIQISKNQYQTIKLNYERYKRLYEKGLVSKFDFEQISLNHRNSQNTLLMAKARLKELENQYNYLKIKAPNNGLIIKKNIRIGEMAIPGIPALVLSDLSSLKISAQIPQSELINIHKNQSVKIVIDVLEQVLQGKIIAIIPNTNPMTHTMTLKIDFQSIKNIFPGMYAKVIIQTKEKQ